MFSDMVVSDDLVERFAAQRLPREAELELSVRVLTAGCWHTYSTAPMAVPAAVQSGLDIYGAQAAVEPRHVALRGGGNFPRGHKELVLFRCMWRC